MSNESLGADISDVYSLKRGSKGKDGPNSFSYLELGPNPFLQQQFRNVETKARKIDGAIPRQGVNGARRVSLPDPPYSLRRPARKLVKLHRKSAPETIISVPGRLRSAKYTATIKPDAASTKLNNPKQKERRAIMEELELKLSSKRTIRPIRDTSLIRSQKKQPYLQRKPISPLLPDGAVRQPHTVAACTSTPVDAFSKLTLRRGLRQTVLKDHNSRRRLTTSSSSSSRSKIPPLQFSKQKAAPKSFAAVPKNNASSFTSSPASISRINSSRSVAGDCSIDIIDFMQGASAIDQPATVPLHKQENIDITFFPPTKVDNQSEKQQGYRGKEKGQSRELIDEYHSDYLRGESGGNSSANINLRPDKKGDDLPPTPSRNSTASTSNSSLWTDMSWWVADAPCTSDSDSANNPTNVMLELLTPQETPRHDVAETSNEISELIRTEKTYIKGLEHLHHFATDSAVADFTKNIPLFTYLQPILGLNKKFLDILLSSRDVCYTFKQMAQFFKMYKSYIQNHDSALKALEKLKKEKRCFRKAVKRHESLIKNTIQSLLILPIQRICRYKLLLENIIASTPPLEFTTREDLSVSFRLITDITRHINHAMGEGDEVKKILAIQSLFTGNVTLLAPHRRFILQKTVKKTTSHGDLVPRELFLFSDMLVYGAKNNFSRKLSLRHPLKINGLFRVEDDVRPSGPDDHPLYIASQARNMMVHFRSKADKDEFKIALDECIANRRQKIGYNNYRRGGMVSK
mmetsp:Transcript_18753/g.30943  ORF Transcript_18753/g.30943 Transcript_18753/m.30943 type:complete len:746 (+) Transcript_18753:126-2363(+)